ncbi:S8 family serine peptidase [bacterium]|nr:S8 family serine peptidase [bacterium]
MNILIIIGRVFSALAIILLHSQSYAQSDRVPNEYVISFDRNKNFSSSFKAALESKGLRIEEEVNAREKIYQVHYADSSIPTRDRIKQIQKLAPSAIRVEPNYRYHAFFGPTPPPQKQQPPIEDGLPTLSTNDPFFNNLWGLRNIAQKDSSGQTGLKNADSASSKAWMQQTSAENVIIAIIDTGVDYNHPDLAANMWQGRDPNGKLIHGFNAIANNFDPMDDNRHGTHVAGTIGAVGNNGVGVVGVAWKTQIMAVKFLDSDGSGALADAIQAIDFAIENGANVMNNSWGAKGIVSKELEAAVARARDAGIVFVAAAGNDGTSNDGSANNISYPASYKLSNVISVAASDNKDQMPSFSNYGKSSVHLMAPGVNIFSTTPGMRYDSFNGTSMATPHVSGAIALLLEKHANLSPLEVRNRLMKSSDKISTFKDKLISSGRLNVYNLLEDLQGSAR